MKPKPLAILLAALLAAACATSAPAPEAAAQAEGSTPEAAAAMAAAADRFLRGLSPEQRATATFAMDAAERLRWNFIPTESHRREGLQLKHMSLAQRALAHELLRTALSPGGYRTATAVIELEGVLRDIEGAGARFVRDPEKYYFSVFGTPASRGSWGWRVEGHHLSLHFTVVDGAWVATAPAFLGSNPAEVRQGPRAGLRILAEREDVARQLVRSLDQAQRAVAIISATAPNEIVTGAKVEIAPLSPVGIRADALRPDQRSLLTHLIGVYASLMTDELATARLEALRRAGLDGITFAWAGGTEPRERHYYRIQGPTFLIELDNSQNDGNHVHSVWRDFDGDFGRDILREHLRSVAH